MTDDQPQDEDVTRIEPNEFLKLAKEIHHEIELGSIELGKDLVEEMKMYGILALVEEVRGLRGDIASLKGL